MSCNILPHFFHLRRSKSTEIIPLVSIPASHLVGGGFAWLFKTDFSCQRGRHETPLKFRVQHIRNHSLQIVAWFFLSDLQSFYASERDRSCLLLDSKGTELQESKETNLCCLPWLQLQNDFEKLLLRNTSTYCWCLWPSEWWSNFCLIDQQPIYI